jgi:membrane fusion protein, multidrug efflux system
MRSDWKRWSLALALALHLAALTLACGESESSGEKGDAKASASKKADEKGKDGKEGKEGEEDEAVPVAVTTLARGRIESILRFSTHLEAEREVQVFSQAARQVRQLLAEEGDEVRRGQVLLRLQDEEQRTALARVESQLAKARKEYVRQQSLFEQQLISEQAFNDATYEQQQLELALQDAQRELGYTEVRAPISGTVTLRQVNVGDHITLNQHLFDIVDFDSIVARVYVPEKELSRIRVGEVARVTADATGGEERAGEVLRIAPRVDPKSGTVKATVAIPRVLELLPGMYVSVSLVTNVHDDAILVPKRALVHDGDQQFVFRIQGESVERLRVQSALEDRDSIEPESGLEVGDRVVVVGQAGLKEGTTVRIVEPTPATAPSPEADPELEES